MKTVWLLGGFVVACAASPHAPAGQTPRPLPGDAGVAEHATAQPIAPRCQWPTEISLSVQNGRALINGSDTGAVIGTKQWPEVLQSTLLPCAGDQYHYSFELTPEATAESTDELFDGVPVRPNRIEVLNFAKLRPISVVRAIKGLTIGHWVMLRVDANAISVRELRQSESRQREPSVVSEHQLRDLATAEAWLRSTCEKERCLGLILSLSHEQPNAVIASALRAVSSPNAPPPLLALRAAEAAHDELRLQFGRLAPEEIQRVVRKSYDTFRVCYEAGLGRNAKLEGRVSVRFVIDLDGSVRDSSLDSATLPDPEVVQCIAHSFTKLHFPVPDGGIVTVVYPIMLSPG